MGYLSSLMTNKEVNQHIPKYIVNKPWYETTGNGEGTNDDDYLSHHRKNKHEIIDYSIAQPGTGIEENEGRQQETYDAKRDRWYGYDLHEWEEMLDNWDEKKLKKSKLNNNDNNDNNDTDDTDYELELFEMNLSPQDIRSNIKENLLEKTVRDRQDIASYIHNITSNPDNKIRFDAKSTNNIDSTSGLINDDDHFVRKSNIEAEKASNLQKFAWEINQQEDQVNKTKTLEASLKNEKPDISVNLENNLEASPTLMLLKEKQHQQQLKLKSDMKKLKLLSMYGGQEFLNEEKSF